MYREIELMEDENGKSEALEFIEKMDEKTQLKIEYVFKLVEDVLIVPTEYLKRISSQIYEIRVQTGNNIYRFFCFFYKGNLVIVTHGFQKKSQKTPSKEIARAEKLRDKYLAKHGG